MKLTETVIAEGRALVMSGDIEKLMVWAREHAPVGLTFELYERNMRMCFIARDTAKALKMHNAVFDEYDVDVELLGVVLRRGAGCLIALAFVGGIVAAVAGIVALVRWAL